MVSGPDVPPISNSSWRRACSGRAAVIGGDGPRLGSRHGCRCWLIGLALGAALVPPPDRAEVAAQIIFSLDNRPRMPISIDPLGFGNSAEDPFGLVPEPTLVGPSPSLNTFSGQFGRTLSDADLLVAGTAAPEIHVTRPLDTNYLSAVSSNHASADGLALRLAFSVDRASTGIPSTAVHEQFLLNQQPGDIFYSDVIFPAPQQFVGTVTGPGWFGTLPSAGAGGGNRLLVDESTLKLTAGLGPGTFIDSTTPAPPITPGSHDHVDAFDFAPFDTSGNGIADKHVYYSVNPDQPTLNPLSYSSAADVYVTAPESQMPTLFAPAFTMGLDSAGPNSDDVNALILFDRGTAGVLEPGVDYALFSLSPGSGSLLDFELTAADIFFTDFSGSFATFALDADLGLMGTILPAELGIGSGVAHGASFSGTDNASGASAAYLGDLNWDQVVDGDDVPAFLLGLTRFLDYFTTYDQRTPVAVGDFFLDNRLDFDDIPGFRTCVAGNGQATACTPVTSGSSASVSIPEPVTVGLAAMALVGLVGVRLRLTSCTANRPGNCPWASRERK